MASCAARRASLSGAADRGDVILGAGLAGLSAAWTLAEGGDDGWQLFEKEERAGGHCRSTVIDGYTFDYGPHILFTVDDEIEALIRDLLGDNMRSQQRRAFIYHHAYGIHTRFPFQAHLYGLPVNVVRDCLVDLIKAVEARARGEFAPQNYEEWMRGFFGDAISETLMIPYARKLWTVEPSTMEFSWIGRRVPTPDVARIVIGALTDDVAEIGATANFWYPWKGGAEALPAALAARVQGVNLGTTVEHVDLSRRTVHLAGGERVAFDRLLWTLPLIQLSRWIPDLPPRVEQACSQLEYQGILNINLGIARPDVSEMHWVYFYEDDFPFHRLSFPATFSPDNVPEGRSSIATEVAFPPGRAPSHDEALERTLTALRTAGILEAGDEVEVVHVHEVEPAYVIYGLHHAEAVETIRAWLREQNVWTAGRFGEWGYLNMDHAMRSGREAARDILRAAGR